MNIVARNITISGEHQNRTRAGEQNHHRRRKQETEPPRTNTKPEHAQEATEPPSWSEIGKRTTSGDDATSQPSLSRRRDRANTTKRAQKPVGKTKTGRNRRKETGTNLDRWWTSSSSHHHSPHVYIVRKKFGLRGRSISGFS
ncbi:hypothetical protein QL285_019267 [Trifolium repens]|nr:hypothetical protein QL285_019267 [Trifolium repens]